MKISSPTDVIFELMARAWSAPVVARRDVPRFSGGGISTKFLANCDSLGIGPKGRFKLGRCVMYPKDELVAWLKAHSREVV